MAASQGSVVQVESPPEAPAVGQGKRFWDAHRGCMVEAFKGGTLVVAQMQPGAGGFLEAIWPDGTRTTTDRPNLVKKGPSSIGTSLLTSDKEVEEEAEEEEEGGEDEGEEDEGGEVRQKPAQASSQPGPLRRPSQTKVGALPLAVLRWSKGKGDPTKVKQFGDTSYKLRVWTMRSDIRVKTPERPRWTLLVQVLQSQAERYGKDHTSVVQALWEALPLTKAEALQRRNEALAKHP